MDCECIVLISIMAAENCPSNTSSAAVLSEEVPSEAGVGVDVRV